MLLIVDNDPRFLEFAEQTLDEPGGVLFALNADEAMWLMGKMGLDFSAALIDLSLPGVVGFELIREIRRSYPDLPVIAVSGALPQHILESAKALGASDVLSKPVTLEWNAVIARARVSQGVDAPAVRR
jgi:CheY-like chemotaxis protein